MPPADSFAPDFHRKPQISYQPPNSFPYTIQSNGLDQQSFSQHGFGQNSFSQHNFGQQNFGQQNFGQQNFGQQNFGKHSSSQHNSGHHGSFNIKQYPVNSPRHPIPFRQPVPQGLLESIGQSVQHQDTFGVQHRPQQPVYLPPPTNEIPPPQG